MHECTLKLVKWKLITNLSLCKHLAKFHFKKKELIRVDSKLNVNSFVLRYTQHFLFFYLCFCSVLLIFWSFSAVLASCLWSLSWSDFSFLSLSLSRPGEIRIQFHSLISGFGIRSQSGSYNRASLCFYWWSGEHWTLKSTFRHFSLSVSVFARNVTKSIAHSSFQQYPPEDKKSSYFQQCISCTYWLCLKNE